jgi:hypothetical protein
VKRSRKQPESQVLAMARLNLAGTCAYHQHDRAKYQPPDKAVLNSLFTVLLASSAQGSVAKKHAADDHQVPSIRVL